MLYSRATSVSCADSGVRSTAALADPFAARQDCASIDPSTHHARSTSAQAFLPHSLHHNTIRARQPLEQPVKRGGRIRSARRICHEPPPTSIASMTRRLYAPHRRRR